jgi:hypothetical protein
MITTTNNGLSKDEYNALIHAIWRLDRLIADHNQNPNMNLQKLERDRKALSNLFVRIN